jgi:hypothetical protein
MLTLSDECSNCHGYEERTFRDSWTGMDLCLMCLAPIASQITMSPGMEGDNLKQLLEGDEPTMENDNDDVNEVENLREAAQTNLSNNINR